jgi:hypothetical protein
MSAHGRPPGLPLRVRDSTDGACYNSARAVTYVLEIG